jgi:hypothetical protein
MALFVTNAIKTKRDKMALLCFGQTEEKVGPLGDETLPNGLETLARQRESKEVVGTVASLASLAPRAALQLRRRPKLHEAWGLLRGGPARR